MSVRVSTTKEIHQSNLYETWEVACAAAVREALDGAIIVVITNADGTEYGINAWRREDNS